VVNVVDRGLSAVELDWLRLAPALIYDAERSTPTRTELLRRLERLRGERRGEVLVRAVKCTGQDRTPLERFVISGSDWALELSHSLSAVGTRVLTVARLSAAARAQAERELIEPYWSIALLSKDLGQATAQALDL
jgi:hypothetical protein